jgi:hypothetical protein
MQRLRIAACPRLVWIDNHNCRLIIYINKQVVYPKSGI